MSDAEFVFPLDGLIPQTIPCQGCGVLVEFRSTATPQEVAENIEVGIMDFWCPGCWVARGAEHVLEEDGQ